MFPNTQWSQVRDAITEGGNLDPVRIEALCLAYYEPISQFIRSICPQPDDAEDLTQGFMAGLAQGKYISSADPRAGKFRSLLCQCARNFARVEWQRRSAQKRGGGAEHIVFDETNIEVVSLPAVAEFDRAWVKMLLERTLSKLREEHASRGGSTDFDLLIEGFDWIGGGRPPAELASLCQLSRGAYATAVHRLKRRFGEHLRSEVRSLVTTDEEAEEELRYYLALFPESR